MCHNGNKSSLLVMELMVELMVVFFGGVFGGVVCSIVVGVLFFSFVCRVVVIRALIR